jgi:hypothetical protein
VSFFVWLLPLDLSGMGDPTSSYATTGIALRVSGALKPHQQDKVETPSVGSIQYYTSIKGKVNSLGVRNCKYHASVHTLQITYGKRVQKKDHVRSQKCGEATNRPIENGGRGHNCS